MKAIRIGQNKSGKRFAIVRRGAGYIVIAECKNYQLGQTVVTWRVCQPSQRQPHAEYVAMTTNGMALAEAEALFNKKVVKPKKAEAA